eukprot:1146629-Pelagomonas_calceolata.AAC.1
MEKRSQDQVLKCQKTHCTVRRPQEKGLTTLRKEDPCNKQEERHAQEMQPFLAHSALFQGINTETEPLECSRASHW